MLCELLCESTEITENGTNPRKFDYDVLGTVKNAALEFFAPAQPLNEDGEFGRGRCAEVIVQGVFEVFVVPEGSPSLALAGQGAEEPGVRLGGVRVVDEGPLVGSGGFGVFALLQVQSP